MFPLSDPDLIRRTNPYVTYGLILLNAIVFLYELTLGDLQTTVFFYTWGLIPAELAQELWQTENDTPPRRRACGGN